LCYQANDGLARPITLKFRKTKRVRKSMCFYDSLPAMIKQCDRIESFKSFVWKEYILTTNYSYYNYYVSANNWESWTTRSFILVHSHPLWQESSSNCKGNSDLLIAIFRSIDRTLWDSTESRTLNNKLEMSRGIFAHPAISENGTRIRTRIPRETAKSQV